VNRQRPEMEIEHPPLDLLWGVEAISKVVRRTERQTGYMLAKGLLPGRKVGGLWVSSRSSLCKFLTA
jgi:hypothetical protein